MPKRKSLQHIQDDNHVAKKRKASTSMSPPADNTKSSVAESNKTNENETLKQKLDRTEEELRLNNKQNEELKRQSSKSEEYRKTLEARIEQLEKEVELLKEKLKQVQNQLYGNNRWLHLGSMCDQLQENFYRIVFPPHQFTYKQCYQARYIERDINNGWYGLSNRRKKRLAKQKWDNLKKTLRWNPEDHVPVIKDMKDNRVPVAHPLITKEMREMLEQSATVLKDEGVIDPYRFTLVNELIGMFSKTEDLV
jgi:DNA repair exonuclease SbcCD ATPase subunit